MIRGGRGRKILHGSSTVHKGPRTMPAMQSGRREPALDFRAPYVGCSFASIPVQPKGTRSSTGIVRPALTLFCGNRATCCYFSEVARRKAKRLSTVDAMHWRTRTNQTLGRLFRQSPRCAISRSDFGCARRPPTRVGVKLPPPRFDLFQGSRPKLVGGEKSKAAEFLGMTCPRLRPRASAQSRR